MTQLTPDNENELVNRLLTGDKQAFDIIYKKYASALYRYVYSYLNIKEESEEVLQEIFTSLWNNRGHVSKVTNLKSYLYRAAKNNILNYFRAARVRKKYADDFAIFEAHQDNSVHELYDLNALQSVIDKSIVQLPERCQKAFRMSRMEHLPISRIAEEMKISTRTVENYITQALKHFRAVIGE